MDNCSSNTKLQHQHNYLQTPCLFFVWENLPNNITDSNKKLTKVLSKINKGEKEFSETEFKMILKASF